MKRALLSTLVIACFTLTASVALAAPGDLAGGKLALHGYDGLKGQCLKNIPTDIWCDDTGDGNMVTEGRLGTLALGGISVYVIAVDVPAAFGMSGAAFGFQFTPSNYYYPAFNKCLDQQFSDPDFPLPGNGGVIASAGCEQTPAPSDPENHNFLVIGWLYMYAYGDDVVQIQNRPVDTAMQLVDCGNAETPIPPEAGGSFGFGTSLGSKPCQEATPVELNTWGNLKRTLGSGE